jgi:Methylene-tetrahydrofolate reductase C terminal
MYAVRLWSVRHSRLMERSYKLLEATLIGLAPLLARIGYGRLEKPFAWTERQLKGLLFDCQMCGQCALSSTGMSCPMNCPKNLRNGPCGGVRSNGHCEVKPEMRCVWVAAWEGASAMSSGTTILDVQKPVDHSLKGSSSWLRVVREKTAPPAAAPPKPKAVAS